MQAELQFLTLLDERLWAPLMGLTPAVSCIGMSP